MTAHHSDGQRGRSGRLGARRAVFLDRDGVLNEAILRDGRPHPPASIGDVAILPGVRDACAQLRAAGYLLVVVTNQPDIARGTTTRAAVDAINDHLAGELGLDAVCVCPHDDADRCGCRKPAPGLLLSAAERFGIELGASLMVGDRWRDIEAGARAGVPTAWVRSDYREAPPAAPDHVVDGLLDVVPIVSDNLTAVSPLKETPR
jgi:D-glycero-D-manno-heptose 1,7-bisphosphate phosphatase